MDKINIGVFFGGKSPEHDVSIITGELIISELKKMDYKVTPIYLSKEGSWHIGQELGALKFFKEKNSADSFKKLNKFYLDLEKSNGKIIFKEKGWLAKEICIDLAFPAFHGANGEDGTIQGLFEIVNIPYVGCDVASSAIAMDKILTKLFYKSLNIPTTDFYHFTKTEWENDKAKIISDIEAILKYPLFVKPPKLGSSIGISKVNNKKELEFAIEVALHYGERVLVENGVENLMDVTCCLVGNENPIASLLQESVFASDLFNFQDKYLEDGGAQFGNSQSSLVIPARLDEKITESIINTAKIIYKTIGCSGIARIDFLYNKATQEIFANEINPMPGTVYHHLWKASGLELNELLNKLIGFAQDRQAQKEKITHTFESDILKMANSLKLKK